MRAAGVRVIQQSHIAGPQFKRADGCVDGGGHRAQVHRHVVAHGQNFASAVKHGAGIIAALLDIRRKSGAAQDAAHFFGNGMENALEDLEADRIEAHGVRSITRLP